MSDREQQTGVSEMGERTLVEAGMDLRKAMDERGISLRETASMVGCSYQSVLFWTRGVFSPTTLARQSLKQVFGVDFFDGVPVSRRGGRFGSPPSPRHERKEKTFQQVAAPLVADAVVAAGESSVLLTTIIDSIAIVERVRSLPPKDRQSAKDLIVRLVSAA